ncbi:threonylcarbamoyladenosine tRNA methylthiotransferase-like [Gigantopelta aegis]|uniref:threonylcarbamoyladenosine tRNA methylthiotransferase-like n=1 Tax=Gigantopelta aegis TaxID=1735272 RepID=UPI001B88D8C5|nr:threonylcarbamoyladenosine tRNA methylthiotransferase-like [Gigantopelta aegis]
MPALVTNVDDIEDIVRVDDVTVQDRVEAKKYVLPRARKTRTPNSKVENGGTEEKVQAESYIPGTQSVFVKTWGCSHNNSDSEYMAGQLASYGYKITENKDEADLWLLNSCTVKNPAEDHFRNEINSANKLNKHVVLAGCVPQGQPKSEYTKGLSIIGVQQIDRVVEVVEETLKGHTVRLFGQKKQKGKKTGGAALNLPKIRKNPLIEIIAINTGCLNQCTYCKTKHARGELGSYHPDEIVARAKQSFEEGVVEIWLTSEDLGAYGHDIGVTLPELLWKLVEVIPEGARMRLGMTNPPYILEHLEEMSKILNHPRVYSFLHVPVQSASDSVLMDMKREYCVADFKHVVDFLRDRVPGVNVATDLICGFPTETEEDFQETMDLVKEYKFASLFINQFFPRPGTPAAKMPRVHPQEVKKRTKRVSELFQSYYPYGHQLGEVQQVLVTEVSHDGLFYVAHNQSYDQVLVPKDDNLMGKMFEVEIMETGKHFLKGRQLSKSSAVRPDVPPPLKKGEVSGVFERIHYTSSPWQSLFLVLSFGVICVAVIWRLHSIYMSFR